MILLPQLISAGDSPSKRQVHVRDGPKINGVVVTDAIKYVQGQMDHLQDQENKLLEEIKHKEESRELKNRSGERLLRTEYSSDSDAIHMQFIFTDRHLKRPMVKFIGENL